MLIILFCIVMDAVVVGHYVFYQFYYLLNGPPSCFVLPGGKGGGTVYTINIIIRGHIFLLKSLIMVLSI